MAKTKSEQAINKKFREKHTHEPIDPDQKAILVIHHPEINCTIKTRGWTLNEVLSIMGWDIDDVWSTFKRTWTKDRGAYVMGVPAGFEEGLSKLNPEGG